MNANELRIGNWVAIIGIANIQIDAQRILAISNGDDTYEPIPLTDEWLLKFGFDKKYRIDSVKLNECFVIWSFAVMIRDNSFFIDWIGGNTEMKYVHQLQNIYFALTGKELELKK